MKRKTTFPKTPVKGRIRINSELDIPAYLESSIIIVNDTIHMTNGAQPENCPIGSLIGYEKSATLSSGWKCWCEKPA